MKISEGRTTPHEAGSCIDKRQWHCFLAAVLCSIKFLTYSSRFESYWINVTARSIGSTGPKTARFYTEGHTNTDGWERYQDRWCTRVPRGLRHKHCPVLTIKKGSLVNVRDPVYTTFSLNVCPNCKTSRVFKTTIGVIEDYK